MADPAFDEMEAETETFVPRTSFRGTRADKLTEEAPNPPETSPLLGPPVLSEKIKKKWYNTSSVLVFWKSSWLISSGVLVVTGICTDGVELWGNNGSQD